MKKISYAKLALSLLLVSTVLVGCGKGTNSVSTQTSQPSPATVAQSPQLQAIDSAFEELKTEQKTFIDNLNQAINITDKKDRESITSDKVSKKIENLQQKIKEYRQNQMPKLKEGEKASVEQILDSIDNTLVTISQKVITPFKQGLTRRDAIENVQKNLGFFEAQNIDPQYYGNLGKTTVEEITTFLQDEQKSLEDSIKQLKSLVQGSTKPPIDPEIQKLSNRIAQLEKEKTSSNLALTFAFLALLASVISWLKPKFDNKWFDRLKLGNQNPNSLITPGIGSTDEIQFSPEVCNKIYDKLYPKFSQSLKTIEQKLEDLKTIEKKITQQNREIEELKRRIFVLENRTKAPEVSEPKKTIRKAAETSIEVSPTEESLANREMGGTDPIVLKNKRRGIYGVYLDENYHCLVPSQNFRINQNNYKSVEDLFECQNYDPNYSDSYTVIRPAVVYPLAGGQTWQLQQRGVLRF
jgi:polyhydroxyalkanoate synthesis regulator phasin